MKVSKTQKVAKQKAGKAATATLFRCMCGGEVQWVSLNGTRMVKMCMACAEVKP